MSGSFQSWKVQASIRKERETVHPFIFRLLYLSLNMPRTPRCKCIDCDRTFDSNQVREVGDGLLRLFLAIRLSKRISCYDTVCSKCRGQFLNWQKKMEGDFDRFDRVHSMDLEYMNNKDDSVRMIIFDTSDYIKIH